MDPYDLRCRIRAELAADPERQERVARAAARFRSRHAARLPALTRRDQDHDFETAEASIEREHERNRR